MVALILWFQFLILDDVSSAPSYCYNLSLTHQLQHVFAFIYLNSSYEVAPVILLLQKMKKKMETTRDQLAEALYQKGLALMEIESLKVVKIISFWLQVYAPLSFFFFFNSIKFVTWNSQFFLQYLCPIDWTRMLVSKSGLDQQDFLWFLKHACFPSPLKEKKMFSRTVEQHYWLERESDPGNPWSFLKF